MCEETNAKRIHIAAHAVSFPIGVVLLFTRMVHMTAPRGASARRPSGPRSACPTVSGLGLCRGGASTGQRVELPGFEVDELLLSVHLDDQGDDEDEEGGGGDPGGLACGGCDSLYVL